MSDRILAAEEFGVAAEVVFQALTDVSNMSSWASGVRTIAGQDLDPLRVGARWVETRERGAEVMRSEAEVLLLEPPTRFAIRYAIGAAQAQQQAPAVRLDYYVKARGAGGSRVELAVSPDGKMNFVMKLLFGFMVKALSDDLERVIASDLRDLKAHLEGGAAR